MRKSGSYKKKLAKTPAGHELILRQAPGVLLHHDRRLQRCRPDVRVGQKELDQHRVHRQDPEDQVGRPHLRREDPLDAFHSANLQLGHFHRQALFGIFFALQQSILNIKIR